MSYYRRLYDDGVPDLDFGSARNSLLVLASADVKGFHYDANALFNEQTDGAHRLQTGQTLSISHPLKGKFSLSRGNLALHAALSARSCGWELVGRWPIRREKIWCSTSASTPD